MRRHYKHFLSKQLHGIELTYLLQYLPTFLPSFLLYFLPYFLFLLPHFFRSVYLFIITYHLVRSSQLSIMRHICLVASSGALSLHCTVFDLFLSRQRCAGKCGVVWGGHPFSSRLTLSYLFFYHPTTLYCTERKLV